MLMTLPGTDVHLLKVKGKVHSLETQTLSLLLGCLSRLYGPCVYLPFSTPLLSLVNIIYLALYQTDIRS